MSRMRVFFDLKGLSVMKLKNNKDAENI